MKILDFPQGTAEWAQVRAGRVTASRLGDVLAKIKTGEAAARRDYRAQLVAEMLTGQPQEDTYVSKEMQWGIDNEDEAASAYEMKIKEFTEKVGFVVHPSFDWSGCSPDRLVGKVGMAQFKCPKTATHLSYLTDGVVPKEYQPQMLWEMAVCEREWSDFVSFDPRLPANLRLFVIRLPRDAARIKAMEAGAVLFKESVDRQLETVRRFA